MLCWTHKTSMLERIMIREKDGYQQTERTTQQFLLNCCKMFFFSRRTFYMGSQIDVNIMPTMQIKHTHTSSPNDLPGLICVCVSLISCRMEHFKTTDGEWEKPFHTFELAVCLRPSLQRTKVNTTAVFVPHITVMAFHTACILHTMCGVCQLSIDIP